MKKERPILFSTPMVQALLAGRKTQTRRIVKMPKEDITEATWGYSMFTPEGHISFRGKHANGQFGESFVKSPYGMKGDILWVRETWCHSLDQDGHFLYRATEPKAWDPHDGCSPWKPSIHMPKSAARIWLEITGVQVERLEEISEKDAIAEGVDCYGTNVYRNYSVKEEDNEGYVHYSSARLSYHSLWESINGEGSWNDDPWVWVVTFKVLSTTGKPAHLNQPS